MFYSLAPNPAIFYGIFIFLIHFSLVILQTLPGFEGPVAWRNFAQLTLLLTTSNRVDTHALNKFHKFDLYLYTIVNIYINILYRNSDDNLSINQFFNFVSQCPELVDTLYQFREQLIETFFPNKYHLVILTRRLYMNMIRDYQIIHNGKLPSALSPSILRNLQPGEIPQQHLYSCTDILMRKLRNQPHPFKSDYSPDRNINISYADICTMIIRKYCPEYVHIREKFHLKHLTHMSAFQELNEIDAYYLYYHRNMPRCRARSEETISGCNFVATSSVSLNLSRKSSILQQQQQQLQLQQQQRPPLYNMKKNVRSILRKSSNSLSKSRKTSIATGQFQKRTISLSSQNCNSYMNSLSPKLLNFTEISPNNIKSCGALCVRSRRRLVSGDSRACEYSNTSFEGIPEIVN